VKISSVVVVLEVERVVLSTSILLESAFYFSFNVELSEVVTIGSAATTPATSESFPQYHVLREISYMNVILWKTFDNLLWKTIIILYLLCK